MKRKAHIVHWAPILHGYGWTSRQAAQALHCSAQHYCAILRDLGIVPKPAATFEEALARLTPDERVALQSLYSVN